MGTRVMLVEDHQLMREVLEHLLAGERDIEVVRAVPSAEEAMHLVELVRSGPPTGTSGGGPALADALH